MYSQVVGLVSESHGKIAKFYFRFSVNFCSVPAPFDLIILSPKLGGMKPDRILFSCILKIQYYERNQRLLLLWEAKADNVNEENILVSNTYWNYSVIKKKKK